jgi:hypothetical protein
MLTVLYVDVFHLDHHACVREGPSDICSTATPLQSFVAVQYCRSYGWWYCTAVIRVNGLFHICLRKGSFVQYSTEHFIGEKQ